MIHSRLRVYVLAISAIFLFNSESTWANAQVKISLDCKLDDATVNRFKSSSLFSEEFKKYESSTESSFRLAREFTLKSIAVDKEVNAIFELSDGTTLGSRYLWTDETLTYMEMTSSLIDGAVFGLFWIDRAELTYRYSLKYDDNHWSLGHDMLDQFSFHIGTGNCVVVKEKKKKF